MPTTRSRPSTPSAAMSAGASPGIVLGPLDGPGQRGRPAGDQADDHLGRRAERRRALRGVEDTRAGPTSPRRRRSAARRCRNRSAVHSIARAIASASARTASTTRGILGVHERDDLASAQRVDRLGARVARLGEQVVFQVHGSLHRV